MSATNKSAAKVLTVLFALRGHYIAGVSNKQLSESLNETPVFITRITNARSKWLGRKTTTATMHQA